MNAPLPNAYDLLPYANNAYAQTHPDRAYVVARMFGMTPTPPSSARVLEIGCARGGNLVPMAMQLPNATFVGIDLSARQIAEANEMRDAVGARNVEFRQLDLAALDDSLGTFDYIVVHGVYSWIPPEARARLLEVLKARLAPQGVAFVSYNTYPGWHMRGMLRDMMVYHASRFANPVQRVQQSRALLDFLAANVPTENNAYGMLLKREAETIRHSDDSYIAHEFLEEHNDPVYFHQFAERALSAGLMYLADVDLTSMLTSNLTPPVAQTLNAIATDVVQVEQYMDFLRNRQFRQSLLVHNGVPFNRNITWTAIEPLHVVSPLRPEGDGPVDLGSDVPLKFAAPAGGSLTTPRPIVKAALTLLAEAFPQALPVATLAAAARVRLEEATGQPAPDGWQDAEFIASDLVNAYAAGIVEMRGEPFALETRVTEYPAADAFARWQAARGPVITSRRHERAQLDDFSAQLVARLDGTRDHAALVEEMIAVVNSGDVQIRKGTEPITDPAELRTAVDALLRQCLPRLARSGLLVA